MYAWVCACVCVCVCVCLSVSAFMHVGEYMSVIAGSSGCLLVARLPLKRAGCFLGAAGMAESCGWHRVARGVRGSRECQSVGGAAAVLRCMTMSILFCVCVCVGIYT